MQEVSEEMENLIFLFLLHAKEQLSCSEAEYIEQIAIHHSLFADKSKR